ncbi:hypothetical protein AK812_SmicGene16326 [Symbiodinium microadriaticum]|uniref:Uncharacterized protein n=1 Tax=Symbiodinium microadriaticum TaxID=2951 RepID=A0A1Q9E0K4_SYMMI|nr:hypothetical protein AK812_SmicGene16326 [Symbiodinium microadriaticum]CAE7650127.1 unnamed protein product [Symbiodinium microadriaticum]CAE7869294.1 unnamed protein product [Symbiodinium sp. KB8]
MLAKKDKMDKSCYPQRGKHTKESLFNRRRGKTISPCIQKMMKASEKISSKGVDDIELTFDDGSRKVCSAVLRMCSPVFEKMLASGAKKIEVKAATAPEFDAFYSLLMPGYFRSDKITEENLGPLLALSDHYQVDFVKWGCEEKLRSLPVTVSRLVQAHDCGLDDQYVRCLKKLGGCPQLLNKEELEELGRTKPNLLLEVAWSLREESTGYNSGESVDNDFD